MSKRPRLDNLSDNEVLCTPRKRKLFTSAGEKALPFYKKITINNGQQIADAEQSEAFECLRCSAPINGKKRSNLASHLQRVHPSIYEEFIMVKKDHPEVKRLKLLQNAVETVSVNGRPFKWLLDSGYRSNIESKLRKLQSTGYGLNFANSNLPEVKAHLHKMAQQVVLKIKDEVKGRVLCLMVDITTKNNRSIFGASVQFIAQSELKIRSIGMIELHKSHTGIYLAKVICDRLQLFGIEYKQIITITTDNGANVQKMVRDVEENWQNQTEILTNSTYSNDPPNDELIDAEIGALLVESEELTEEQTIHMMIDDLELQSNSTLLATVSSELTNQGVNALFDITGMNCAEHVLQLGIRDGIKALNKNHRNLITVCREVAKFLRLSSIHDEMDACSMNYKQVRLDVATRWGSTHNMVIV